MLGTQLPVRRIVHFGAVTLTLLTGILLGSVAFTFEYAQGTSYLSNDPTACVNCHIMREPYNGWQNASHHHVAVCNDCHLPHETVVEKYIAKGEAGFRHSWGFTFQDFEEPIRVHDGSKRVIENNCVRCHTDLTASMAMRSAHGGADIQQTSCIHCHRDVGHGPTR